MSCTSLSEVGEDYFDSQSECVSDAPPSHLPLKYRIRYDGAKWDNDAPRARSIEVLLKGIHAPAFNNEDVFITSVPLAFASTRCEFIVPNQVPLLLPAAPFIQAFHTTQSLQSGRCSSHSLPVRICMLLLHRGIRCAFHSRWEKDLRARSRGGTRAPSDR